MHTEDDVDLAHTALVRAIEHHVRGQLPSFWIHLPAKMSYGRSTGGIQAVEYIEQAPIGVVGDTGAVAAVLRYLRITEGTVRDAHSDHPDYTVTALLHLNPPGAR